MPIFVISQLNLRINLPQPHAKTPVTSNLQNSPFSTSSAVVSLNSGHRVESESWPSNFPSSSYSPFLFWNPTLQISAQPNRAAPAISPSSPSTENARRSRRRRLNLGWTRWSTWLRKTRPELSTCRASPPRRRWRLRSPPASRFWILEIMLWEFNLGLRVKLCIWFWTPVMTPPGRRAPAAPAAPPPLSRRRILRLSPRWIAPSRSVLRFVKSLLHSRV